jgi:hypothetical protein
MTDHDPFEERLRDTLRSGDPNARPTDVNAFLDDVHSGARSRRRRRVAGAGLAAALVVAGGGTVVANQTLLQDEGVNAADHTTSSTVSTDATDTASTATRSSSSAPESTGPPAPTQQNTTVMSLTATGTEHQWALTKTESDACPRGGCATLFARSSDDGTWSSLGQLPYGAYHNTGDPDTVRQVRFVGSAATGYDGWAYGPGLLSTHDGGQSWQVVRSPDLGSVENGNAIGNVVDLEARGDTAYALMVRGESYMELISSPVGTDDWSAVDTGQRIGTLLDLNVTQGVVAFVDRRGPDVGWVVSSPADDTGAATGDWRSSQPCGDGGVEQLSSAASTLWALCSDGAVVVGTIGASGEPAWSAVNGGPFDPAGLIAARGPDSAVVAQLHGLFEVSVGAGQDTRLGPESFAFADVLGFTNESLGFVVIDGRLLRTDDGGRSWDEDTVLPPA